MGAIALGFFNGMDHGQKPFILSQKETASIKAISQPTANLLITNCVQQKNNGAINFAMQGRSKKQTMLWFHSNALPVGRQKIQEARTHTAHV
ncbi:hypothetical protein A6U96_13985 [Agrobacterium tumefaciens]|nr:hypothetical protein A6U96_13985 [Agrobacterium tumefaciens]